MVIHAYAKINWTLAVTGRYENGYHSLDTLMQTISLRDTLEIEDNDALILENGYADDLVLRAARAIQKKAGFAKGARLRLTKRIPVRAGLGGGSADCAATLRGLNAFWQANLTDEELYLLGANLGADVPFCLAGGFCRVRGFGERVERMNASPKAHLALYPVGGGLSTEEVFRAYDEGAGTASVDTAGAAHALSRGDFSLLAKYGGNSLEPAAIRLMPEIADALQRLLDCGAEYARMTGSGSAVFGAFCDEASARDAVRRMGTSAIYAETMGKDGMDYA
ncbi:MAG: 4-(cytidine 5'-diphospho)-2-C-methyl-D-erythritol kinase [Christensenellales bacterium]|jgi:4-diphosphocytidyl-2-C-methyl-D-erythritol kinase